jgi:serine/threonine protein kinase
VEHNLQDVLHAVWQPWAITDAPLNEQPLWNQMIDVASGLARIHNPDRGNDSIIGFHFDLKPSDILVTNQGLLKITDFGQALIKSVQENDPYGIHRGGSPIYQAPGACASRPSMGSGDVDDKIDRKYDVWSLACIMLEVLIFILDRGPDVVKEFEKKKSQREGGGCFLFNDPRCTAITLC